MNKESSRSHSIFTIYIETAEEVNVNKFYFSPIYIRMELESKRLRQANLTWWILPALSARVKLMQQAIG